MDLPHQKNEYSDSELLDLYSRENESGFRLIVLKYSERLYWHIRKIVISHDDTDDVLQNTFLKAWGGMQNFRRESGLFTWLYRIATNEALSFLNRKMRVTWIPFEGGAEKQLSESLDADQYFDGDELQLKLQKALLTLPEKQRLVFNMKYFDEIKYEDMAEILGTSVGALKASYHHAIKKIEKYMLED
jgi:RNA polymerase sigma-70 factor, ECF subfamily